MASLSAEQAAAAVPRNMFLLAAGMAALYGMVELATGAATLTFEEVGGGRSLAGIAPAAFLAAAAVAALPAGRAMDSHGRAPVLAGGFAIGLVGAVLSAVGVWAESVALVLVGFVLVGFTTGTVLLSRTAAADMYPPERRPRGIALVLFGAVFGALLGPLVFIPLIQSGDEDGSKLASAWLAAGGFMAVGLAIATRIRPDPKRIAEVLGGPVPAAIAAEPRVAILRRPGVASALAAAIASYATMASLMTLAGSSLVDHGHDRAAVFPVLAAHFVGMFGFFAIVGRIIERLGRIPALSGGLTLLAASAATFAAAVHSVPLAALALFGIGLGWSVSYVSATTILAEAVSASERGSLLGFSDLLAGLSGAGIAIAGGAGLAASGVAAVWIGAAALPAAAAVWIAIDAARQPA